MLCCDCDYVEVYLNQNPYGDCKNGKIKEIFVSISLNNKNEEIAKLIDNWIYHIFSKQKETFLKIWKLFVEVIVVAKQKN